MQNGLNERRRKERPLAGWQVTFDKWGSWRLHGQVHACGLRGVVQAGCTWYTCYTVVQAGYIVALWGASGLRLLHWLYCGYVVWYKWVTLATLWLRGVVQAGCTWYTCYTGYVGVVQARGCFVVGYSCYTVATW